MNEWRSCATCKHDNKEPQEEPCCLCKSIRLYNRGTEWEDGYDSINKGK